MLLWLCGVLAAAQLGKFAALGPMLQARFGLDLTATGWLISLLEVGGGLLGFGAGLALPAIGARRALLAGLSLLALTTLCEATASGTGLMFAARGTEGIGYLLVVVAAPTMIVAATRPGRQRDAAMVLWSTFVPVGSGIGSIVTGLITEACGPGVAILAWAAALLAALASVARSPAPALPPRHLAWPAAAAWLLSAGFGCYTLCLGAVVGLMPSFLAQRHGVGTAAGSTIAGIVALSALPGSLIALAAMRNLGGGPRRVQLVCSLGLLLAAGLSLLIFRVAHPALTALIAATMLLLAGVARALIFTRLPAASGGEGAGDPRIGAAQGLLTQFGALGALLGPPLGAELVRLWSWAALGVGVAGFVIMLLALLVGAARIMPPTAASTDR